MFPKLVACVDNGRALRALRAGHFASKSGMEQRIATGDTLRRGGFDPRATTDTMLSNCFPSARWSPRQQRGNVHEIVGEYCRSDPQFEALVALGKAALHAATAEQDRQARRAAETPARTYEKSADFKKAALFAPASGVILPPPVPLRNAHHLDTLLSARCNVLLAEETAI